MSNTHERDRGLRRLAEEDRKEREQIAEERRGANDFPIRRQMAAVARAAINLESGGEKNKYPETMVDKLMAVIPFDEAHVNAKINLEGEALAELKKTNPAATIEMIPEAERLDVERRTREDLISEFGELYKVTRRLGISDEEVSSVLERFLLENKGDDFEEKYGQGITLAIFDYVEAHVCPEDFDQTLWRETRENLEKFDFVHNANLEKFKCLADIVTVLKGLSPKEQKVALAHAFEESSLFAEVMDFLREAVEVIKSEGLEGLKGLQARKIHQEETGAGY